MFFLLIVLLRVGAIRRAATASRRQNTTRAGGKRTHPFTGWMRLVSRRFHGAANRRSPTEMHRLCLWCNTLDFAGCPSKSGVVKIASRHPASAQIAVCNSRCRSPLHRPPDARKTARAHDAAASCAHVSAAAGFLAVPWRCAPFGLVPVGVKKIDELPQNCVRI